ncbi:MAG: Gfo/Idh/MocA family oxidoreductase [Armatimonadetes bacterium]|nr:Gfo/Idh/MocA family oxidoreductase [Armatimonadota bacterium]
MSKPINVGIIGYGFMGRAHSNAYSKLTQFFDTEHVPVMKAACARNRDTITEFAGRWGWESVETDWRALIERPDIDAIDICVPNHLHRDIAVAAARAGKMVLCEKPLAMDASEGREMCEAVERAGVPNLVWFNYRRVPAIALAHQLVDEGRLGRVFHYRGLYLQDWTISEDLPQGGHTLWRLDVAEAGSGVTGDLLAHSIDTAMWLIGGVDSVTAVTETFIKERELQDEPGKVMPVGIDDACAFLVKFKNGAIGTFESTRYARGRKNFNTFEVNGAKAAMYFNLEEAHKLLYYDHADDGIIRGWHDVLVTDSDHPYMSHWWVPGCVIGYEHTFINALADFLTGLDTGVPSQPDFRCALETQLVCDAVLASARTGQWVRVGEA